MSRSRIPENLRSKIEVQFKFRCAYCQTQQQISGIRLTVDHIVPESFGGSTEATNLCLACWDCNLHKATQISILDKVTRQQIRLFHPQQQSWREHFDWSEDSSTIIAKTGTGRVTITALKMNRIELVIARRLWAKVGWHPPEN